MQIPIRWSDNTQALRENLAKGIDQIEATRAAAEKMAKSLGGDNIVAAAHKTAAAIELIGGASKLAASQQERVNGIMTRAVEVMNAAGKGGSDLAKQFQSLADQTKQAEQSTGGWLSGLSALGSSWVARVAEGMLLRDAIRGVINTVTDLAKALPELALRGAAVGDLEENFTRLTSQAGLLGSTLLGALQDGTHRTVDNFALMKLVNQDLAAGLRLTDTQFGVLSKGAFALAQATGVDVASALETMNDAMLTGRTRAIALLTGKIDLSRAEEDFAKSLGTTTDRLSDEGKLEAARIAILKSVGDATERIGEQTDGLDEKVAQAQIEWRNFYDELGKTIAASPVLAAGIDGVRDALEQAFGGDEAAVVKALASAFDDATVAVIGLGKGGVTAAGFLVTEFYAAKKILGDLKQIIDGNRLAIDYFARSINNIASTMQFGDMAKRSAAEADRLNEEIGALLVTMKLRGDALHDDSAKQASVNAVTAKYTETLDALQAKMSAARQQTSDFVGPLQQTAAAQDAAGSAAGRHGQFLQQSKKDMSDAAAAAKKYADALKDLESRGSSFNDVLSKMDGLDIARAKRYLQLGGSVEEVATVLHKTKGEVDAVADAMKLEKLIVDATGKTFADFAKQIGEVEKRHRDLNNSGFVKNLGAEQAALKASIDMRNKLALGAFDYQLFLIKRERDERIASLEVTAEGYADAFAAIEQETGDRMNAASREYAASMRSMQASTGTFATMAIGWLQKIPDTLKQAFTGGGGMSGAAKSIFSGIGGDLGADVFGKMAGRLSGFFSKTFGVGITEKLGSILPGIGAVIGSLAGPMISKIVSFFHKTEAQKLMYDVGRDWGKQISAGLAKQMEADSKKFGRQVAELLHLHDIFAESGGITPENVDDATAHLRDVFVLIGQGQMSIAQGAKVIDENWQDLVAAGTDAFGFISPKLREIISLNETFGTKSKEIAAYLKAQGSAAVSASNLIIGSLAPQITKWKDLKDRIEAAKKAGRDFTGLLKEQRDEVEKNGAELENMGVIALATFSAAVAGGASFSEALAAAGPGLSQLTAAFEALGISTNNAALQALLLQNTILEKNPTLIQGISGLGQAFAALSNMGLLNVETFQAMTETGAAMYARLQGEVAALGGTTKDALLPMQDYLHKAQKAAEELGVPLDENTEELIRQSKELGIWKDTGKTAADKLTDAMETLVKKVQTLINTLLGIPDVDFTVTEHRETDGEPLTPIAPTAGSLPDGYESAVYASRGALIGRGQVQYLDRGGPVLPRAMFRPMGTDTVPAMLTPNELVMSNGQQAGLGNLLRVLDAKATVQPTQVQPLAAATSGGMERVDVHFHMDSREVAHSVIDRINAGGTAYEKTSRLVTRIVTDRRAG